MSEENSKVVEKYYIEVTASAKKRFLLGVVGGLGWGVGITLGTSAIILIIGYFVSRIDFIPILSQFLADVIKSTEPNLQAR